MSDPIVWRGLERLAIVLGAIAFGHLGYRLYALGTNPGGTAVSPPSRPSRFTASGTGPGLLLLVFGAGVLVSTMFTGGAVHIDSDEYHKLSTRIVVAEKKAEGVVAAFDELPVKQAHAVADENQRLSTRIAVAEKKVEAVTAAFEELKKDAGSARGKPQEWLEKALDSITEDLVRQKKQLLEIEKQMKMVPKKPDSPDAKDE